MGLYKSYGELREHEKEGSVYRIRRREGKSGIAVMAPHGGGIEPGTTEIADALAGREHAFYSFEGLKRRGNQDLHLTSRCFDEPMGVKIAASVHTVVTIHGCKGMEEIIFIGGLHETLKEKIKASLLQASFLTQEHPQFPGKSPQNICNRCRSHRGVQLEISRGLRRILFLELTLKKRKIPTEYFEKLVSALKGALSQFDKNPRIGP